ncbi:hypothetical protein [Nocardia caishijiensis]|uniref:Excreted virulence factor EspC (Type VII ESX diderm) n=1 Tax=Nocardia caishijiensis TaxID=184756 RepID=A0ABQ6YJK6_9NOCA|nr:hypothetical protein [Nocardia caishijiensis]KAF0845963.1 hypothetical protein FNL39_106355 [Nocardia caishijiensis]
MVGKFETNKDLVQEMTTSGAQRVGNIAALITGTVAGVAREIGEFITDVIEMKEAAAAARRDAADSDYDADEVRVAERPVAEAGTEVVETEVVTPKPVPDQH